MNVRSRPELQLLDLPPRPRPLGLEEIQAIFGGCVGIDAECHEDSDCCALLRLGSTQQTMSCVNEICQYT